MSIPHEMLDQLHQLGLEATADAPLRSRVYWRTGGPADVLVRVTSTAQLQAAIQAARRHEVPVFPLGNGSNLLVSDQGIRGMVIQLAGDLTTSIQDGELLTVGGGLRLNVLLNRARKHGWGGLECLAGIPGTVGGAVRMNAGTSLGEIGDLVLDADILHGDGEIERLPAERLRFAYRHTELPLGSLVVSARLRIQQVSWEVSAERIATFLGRRKETQPLDMPSCGSTFRNPPGDHAGRLIEASGLKGFAIGGAMVSPKHANFIVNTGDATSADIRHVIAHVQATVHTQHGIRMVPEVQLAGEWTPEEAAPFAPSPPSEPNRLEA